ncbi:MAG: hypothetical protein G01um101430_5 [Parcubacteria group bacterium Gr01-1014_30]|nr:MAG: hypothetical protein G01um101430_5 [Parcubacteria group bacterium Gr01-1014_30]
MNLKFKKLTTLSAPLKKLKKLPLFLAKNAFFASLILILLAAILGILVFYEYVFLAERKKPDVLPAYPVLNEAALQDILKTRQERQEKFDQAQFREYNDPF